MTETKIVLGLSHATSRAMWRRASDPRFVNHYFVGRALDIGGAIDGLALAVPFFPRLTGVDTFDKDEGSAEFLETIAPASYDVVYSSHCLEHVDNPETTLARWIEVVKPGGHLVVTIPDEDLYEQGVYPSTFNADHRHTFAIAKDSSWSPVSVNVIDLLAPFRKQVDVLKVELLDHLYRYDFGRFDKCLIGYCESSIEFVLRKRP